MGGVGEFFGIKNEKVNSKINYFEDNEIGWIKLNESSETLKEIFNEVGKVYIPCLIANSEAYLNGDEIWETEIDGSKWKQKTFPYQVKCLSWIKDEFNCLCDDDKKQVMEFLKGTGCESILD